MIHNLLYSTSNIPMTDASLFSRESFQSGRYVEHAPSRTVYKLSEAYPQQFSAQQMLPVPGRTRVHFFAWPEADAFREPSDAAVRKLERVMA